MEEWVKASSRRKKKKKKKKKNDTHKNAGGDKAKDKNSRTRKERLNTFATATLSPCFNASKKTSSWSFLCDSFNAVKAGVFPSLLFV